MLRVLPFVVVTPLITIHRNLSHSPRQSPVGIFGRSPIREIVDIVRISPSQEGEVTQDDVDERGLQTTGNEWRWLDGPKKKT